MDGAAEDGGGGAGAVTAATRSRAAGLAPAGSGALGAAGTLVASGAPGDPGASGAVVGCLAGFSARSWATSVRRPAAEASSETAGPASAGCHDGLGG